MNSDVTPNTIPYKSLYNPYIHGSSVMYSTFSSGDCEMIMVQECLDTINQPLTEKQTKKSQRYDGITILGLLSALALLSAATFYQLPRTIESYQEVADTVSSEMLTLIHY